MLAKVMSNLILADKQEISKAGVLFLSREIRSIESIEEASGKKELIALLLSKPESVVLLDYTTSEIQGCEELQVIRSRFPRSGWILFSEELNNSFLRQITQGDYPFSITSKQDSLEEITNAIEAALSNREYYSERITEQLKFSHPTTQGCLDSHLSVTEQEILREIAIGKTTKEIAASRFLSFHTVSTHRKNIFRKLNVNNRYEAMKYALRAGIINPSEYYI